MKNITLLFLCCLFTGANCNPPDQQPINIRVISGIEECEAACVKLQELDRINENDDCKPYYQNMNIDGSIVNCIDFCKQSMSQSINLNPHCILEKVTVCSRDMQKCGL